MDTIKLQAQIAVYPDQDQKYGFDDNFYESQLQLQIVDHVVKEGLCEFDFTDPFFKRITLTIVKPKKASK